MTATRIESRAYLDCAEPAQYAEVVPSQALLVPVFEITTGPLRCRGPQIALECLLCVVLNQFERATSSLRITLNGEPYDLDEPLSVADLLVRLAIDPRRVAVEHNLVILRRPLFTETLVHEGDRVEIVNFVGGG